MNSPDPWRSIIGAHHHGGGGGGGHHGGHHHGGGRRRFYGGGGGYSYWPYGWWDPYAYDDPTVLVDNRTYYNGEEVGPGGYGPAYVQGALAEPPRRRDGLLELVAPVLAPATGGIQAAFNLDAQHRLNAVVVVDGQTYQGSADLAPVIQALMTRLRNDPTAVRAAGWMDALNEPCGAKLFYGVTENKMSMIIKRLQAEGASFTGNNPWNVSLKNSGFTIKMRGSWNPSANTLHLEVLEGPPGMCDRVWGELNKHLTGVGVSSTPLPPPPPSRSPGNSPAQQPARQQPVQPQAQAPQQPQNGFAVPTAQEVIAAIDHAVAEARQTLVKTLVGQHIDTVSAGWFDGLKHAASSAKRGLSKISHTKALRSTLRKYQGPIAKAAGVAAGAVATVYGGPAAGIIANKLANNLVHAAAGNGSAKQALETARAEAQKDPKLANALNHAEKAVAQTTAAYHVAETARSAADGNRDAVAEMTKLAESAQQGDKAAQAAMQLAQTANAPDGAPVPASQVSGDYEIMIREIAKTAMRNAHRQRGGKFAGEPGFTMPSNQTLGYRRDGERQRVYFFDNRGEASQWFQGNVSQGADYVTIVDRGQLETAGPKGPIVFVAERFGGGPIESVAAVSGPDGDRGSYVVPRVPVLDEDGNLTSLTAAWNASHPVPDYFVESSNGDVWLFEDPAGDVYIDPQNVSPYAPRGMAGKRFRSKDAMVKPPIFGDRAQPGVPMAPTEPGNAPVVGTGGPRVEIIGAANDALAAIRKQATDAAKQYDGRVIGLIRWANGNWDVQGFASTDQADDWLGATTSQPELYVYAAYFDKADATFPNPMNESIGHGVHVGRPRKPATHEAIPRGGVATTY